MSMADNTKLPDPGGASAPVLRSDEILLTRGINILGVKIRLGADGTDGGPVTSSNPLPTGIQKDVAATFTGSQASVNRSPAFQLPVQAPTRAVTIKAHNANTGNIYVGGSTVSTSSGSELGPGELLSIPIDDSSKLYCVASADGQTISWFAI
jgi:hypothetical protein